MSLVIALVSETVINRAVLSPAAKHISGGNYVGEVDAVYHPSPLAEDAAILGAFASDPTAGFGLQHISFLVAGGQFSVGSFIEACRGMTHAGCKEVSPDFRAVIITGSLEDWRDAVVRGCTLQNDLPLRTAFNKIHETLCVRGLRELFKGATQTRLPDNTFLLKYHA